MTRIVLVLSCALLATSLLACNRQESKDDHASVNGTTQSSDEPRVALVPLTPGANKPVVDRSAEGRRIEKDPEQIAAGKQLFTAMNCVGCHFNGGGGMGPPLMDNVWIYGDSIENIAASIREGRPNGMPSFRGFVPDEQIWQLAAYVRSLSNPPHNQTAGQEEKK
ncbi:MAG TPA: c-type cytochrome [Hyphomicrobium sp.]|nr:c-type cytochrome [Hyphomicrobium sp.]